MTPKRTPPDYVRCQTDRPCTWPNMVTFMVLGPVSYSRCVNVPTWLASDGVGSMTLCDECLEVCMKHKPDVMAVPIPAITATLRAVVLADAKEQTYTTYRHNLTPAAAERLIKELQARGKEAYPLAQRKVHTQDARTCTTCRTFLTKVATGTPQSNLAPTRR